MHVSQKKKKRMHKMEKKTECKIRILTYSKQEHGRDCVNNNNKQTHRENSNNNSNKTSDTK